jgi:hypothetical protein
MWGEPRQPLPYNQICSSNAESPPLVSTRQSDRPFKNSQLFTTGLFTDRTYYNFEARMASRKDTKDVNAHAAEEDGDSQLFQEAPPPYEVHSSGPVLASSFAINGNLSQGQCNMRKC